MGLISAGSWPVGRDEIREMLAAGMLERVAPNRAFADDQIAMAREALSAAQLVLNSSPRSSFTLSYDAARLSITAMLLNQGLRTGRGAGGHAALGRAAVAQLGQGTDAFSGFDAMRRIRNESEYPMPDSGGEIAEQADALGAIPRAEAIIDAVEKALDAMGVWSG